MKPPLHPTDHGPWMQNLGVVYCGTLRNDSRREVAVIDNRRKTLHNLHTSMHETIAKVHLDFIASMGAQLLRALGHFSGDSQSMNHAWLRLRVGTDDLPNPYPCPPSPPAILGGGYLHPRGRAVHGALWPCSWNRRYILLAFPSVGSGCGSALLLGYLGCLLL